jgi:putative transcriptional regulator
MRPRSREAHLHDDADSPDETGAARAAGAGGGIGVRLDELLAERGMTLTELADRVGVTIVNLSVLKNGRARAVRFSTLAALCEVLGCQPGDLLRYEAGAASRFS